MKDQGKSRGRAERRTDPARKPKEQHFSDPARRPKAQHSAGPEHKRKERSSAGPERRPEPEKKPETFAEFYFRKTAGRLPGYAEELRIKQTGLNAFWETHGLPGKAPEIIPSPRGRNYRTTSKRKAVRVNGRFGFSMGYREKPKDGILPDGAELEAELHGRIYAAALEILRKPHYQPLADALNFFIIRGSYRSAAAILNVFHLSGDVVRKAKSFAEELREAEPGTAGVSLYFDESRSEYYFESFRPRTPVSFKKLSGASLLDLALPGRPKLLYPLSVFSQVNESMLPVFTDSAFEMLQLTDRTRFIDLYCGYGLFALYGAAQAHSVIGIDFESASVKAARANAEHLHPGRDIRFEAAPVTADTLEDLLPPPDPEHVPETILLDPPRNGTADGVIAAIAARRPEKVLAVYCGIEQMAKEWRLWRANGFEPAEARCFDMFPGSPNLETMLLLKRASA